MNSGICMICNRKVPHILRCKMVSSMCIKCCFRLSSGSTEYLKTIKKQSKKRKDEVLDICSSVVSLTYLYIWRVVFEVNTRNEERAYPMWSVSDEWRRIRPKSTLPVGAVSFIHLRCCLSLAYRRGYASLLAPKRWIKSLPPNCKAILGTLHWDHLRGGLGF